MKNSLSSDGFWNSVARVNVTLVVLAGLVLVAPVLYASSAGRLPASMISIVRSFVVAYNPGNAGYYEELLDIVDAPAELQGAKFEAWAGKFRDVTYDRSFRLYRFKPGLKDLHSASEPQGITTNSFGILGPERSLHKPPDTRRIALLGDSMSQGWGALQKDSYVSLFEKHLNDRAPASALPHVEVLNFSELGYHTTQLLDVALEDVPRFEPDVYMLALTELSIHNNWQEHLVQMIRWGVDPKYDFLRGVIRQADAAEDDPPVVLFGKLAPYRTTILRTILSEMKSRAEQDHAAFIVLLVPSMEDGDMNRKRFDGIPNLVASLGIPVVNLLDTFDGVYNRQQLRVSGSDVHPNAAGHAMIAANLYAKLQSRPKLWEEVTGDR